MNAECGMMSSGKESDPSAVHHSSFTIHHSFTATLAPGVKQIMPDLIPGAPSASGRNKSFLIKPSHESGAPGRALPLPARLLLRHA
jgi:hypothetical protein